MAYLCKKERRASLLEAAACIARQEGLAATTVRRVAQVAGVAVGQVHHHFSSAAELRAQAYARVMKILKEQLDNDCQSLSARERLTLFLISPQDQESLMAIPLWHEAMLLTEQEPLMKSAFAASVADWHQLVHQPLNTAGIPANLLQGSPPRTLPGA